MRGQSTDSRVQGNRGIKPGNLKPEFQNKYIQTWLRALKIGCQMADLAKLQ